ncbi:MAG: 30S ribosomal protein S24e [Promethearchaeia archaeon]
MTYKIEITEERRNPLIDRLEVKFKVDHFGQGTPNRLEIKEKIAAIKGSKIDLTIVKKLRTYFGLPLLYGTAYIYDTQEELEYYEPFHIRVRNLPKDKRVQIYDLKKKGEPYKHLFYETEQNQE